MNWNAEEAAQAIDAVLTNVEAVRGEKFADVVRLMSNVESLARVAVLHGVPMEPVAMGYVAIMSMVAQLAGLSEQDAREVEDFVRTLHSQIPRPR